MITTELKLEIIKDKELVKYYLKNNPEIFEENNYELVEYALVNGYKESFNILFNHFYPDIKKLFKYGFKREYTDLLDYDEYERMHKNYLRCYLNSRQIKKVYDEE